MLDNNPIGQSLSKSEQRISQASVDEGYRLKLQVYLFVVKIKVVMICLFSAVIAAVSAYNCIRGDIAWLGGLTTVMATFTRSPSSDLEDIKTENSLQ